MSGSAEHRDGSTASDVERLIAELVPILKKVATDPSLASETRLPTLPIPELGDKADRSIAYLANFRAYKAALEDLKASGATVVTGPELSTRDGVTEQSHGLNFSIINGMPLGIHEIKSARGFEGFDVAFWSTEEVSMLGQPEANARFWYENFGVVHTTHNFSWPPTPTHN